MSALDAIIEEYQQAHAPVQPLLVSRRPPAVLVPLTPVAAPPVTPPVVAPAVRRVETAGAGIRQPQVPRMATPLPAAATRGMLPSSTMASDPAPFNAPRLVQSREQTEEPLITPRLATGYSPTLTVGGRRGRFNFDLPPETGGTPRPRYAFETEDGGLWNFQLEQGLQGGRWDDAEHAEADFTRYKALDPKTRTATMAAMWGDNPIASVIDKAAGEDVSFAELKKRLKPYNTHRQISDGEPAPAQPEPMARGPRVRLSLDPKAMSTVDAAEDLATRQPTMNAPPTPPVRLATDPNDPAIPTALFERGILTADPVLIEPDRRPLPPRTSPMSMLGTTSAGAGAALGHLADEPGDALGAIAAGATEAGKAVFQPIEEQTSPARELIKRGVPLSPLEMIAVDIGIDPANFIAPEKILAAGVLPASMRRFGGMFRRGAKEIAEEAPRIAVAEAGAVATPPPPRYPSRSPFSKVSGVSDVIERGGKSADVDLTPKALTPTQQAEDAARIDQFINRHTLLNPAVDRPIIADILKKGANFVEERGRVQTWEQTGAMADDLVVDLSKKLPQGTALNAAQTETVRRTAMGLVTLAGEKAAAIRAAEAAGETVKLAEKADALQAMQEAVIGIQSLLGARSEAGRTLNLYKKLVNAREMGDVDFVRRALESGADTMKAAAALATMPDQLSRYRFLRDLAKPSKQDYWRWYYLTNLLSAPITQVRNNVGNTTKMLADISSPAADLQFRETAAGYAGAWAGIKEGWRKAAFMFNEGFSLDDAERLVERGPEVAIAGNRKIPNVVSRAMESGDQFFRTLNAEAAAYQGAFRRIKAKGLTPGTEPFETAMASLLADRPADLIDEMARAGKEGTFRQDPGKALSGLQSARRAVDEVMADFGDWVEKRSAPLVGKTGARVAGTVASMPVGTFVLPFIQTPANILKAGAAYSPYGALKGQLTGDLRLTRQGRLGSLLLAYPAFLAAEGRLTGSGPSNSTEREQWYAEGKQPNSIKIGDTWVSYSQVQPIATPLALIANAFELYQQTGEAPDVGGIVFKLGNSILQQSYLSGVLNLAEAVNDPEGKGARYLGRTASGFVPLSSAVRSVNRTMDPTVRAPRTIAEQVKSGIPGLAQDVPERIDSAGETIETKGGPISRFINPVYASPETQDELRTELQTTGARLANPSDTIKGLPMTQKQRTALEHATGRAQATAMRQVLRSPAYLRMPIDQKVAELEKAASDARAAVRGAARAELQRLVNITVQAYRATSDPKRKATLRARLEEMRDSIGK